MTKKLPAQCDLLLQEKIPETMISTAVQATVLKLMGQLISDQIKRTNNQIEQCEVADDE